jgi:hypothetical protein
MRQRYQSGDRVYEVEVEREGESYRATIDGQVFAFEVLDMQPGVISLRVQGKPTTIYWAQDESTRWLSMSGCTYRLEKPRPSALQAPGMLLEEKWCARRCQLRCGQYRSQKGSV